MHNSQQGTLQLTSLSTALCYEKAKELYRKFMKMKTYSTQMDSIRHASNTT